MKAFFHRHRHRLAFGLLVFFCICGFAWRFLPGQPVEQLKGGVDLLLGWVRTTPFPLFILLVGLLPLTGIPVTALYLSAGAVYAPVYGLPATLGGLALGLALNLSVSYAAAYWFRGPIDRLLRRFGVAIPRFQQTGVWKAIVLVRITPGAPLMVQNLLLGLWRVPFGRYLAISMVTEMLIASGYLTAGHSFSSGRWQLLAIGVGVVGGALLAASRVREKMRAREQGK